MLLNEIGPPLILGGLFIMLTSVQLNHQQRLAAHEVANGGADGHLA